MFVMQWKMHVCMKESVFAASLRSLVSPTLLTWTQEITVCTPDQIKLTPDNSTSYVSPYSCTKRISPLLELLNYELCLFRELYSSKRLDTLWISKRHRTPCAGATEGNFEGKINELKWLREILARPCEHPGIRICQKRTHSHAHTHTFPCVAGVCYELHGARKRWIVPAVGFWAGFYGR